MRTGAPLHMAPRRLPRWSIVENWEDEDGSAREISRIEEERRRREKMKKDKKKEEQVEIWLLLLLTLLLIMELVGMHPWLCDWAWLTILA